MANLLGDWDFLQYWWWRPYLVPLAALASFAGVIALGALVFFAITGSARLSEYRKAVLPSRETEAPADEEALAEFMESFFPEVSEEEILRMERILEDVLEEDIHPEMARALRERGIPVRLLALPSPEIVRAAGRYPAAAWMPRLNAIEIYAAVVQHECGRAPGRCREKMGASLLGEIAHALGLDEPKA